MIGVGRDTGCCRSVQMLGVDVRDRYDFSIGASPQMIREFRRTVTRADESDANAFVGAQGARRSAGQRSGQAVCDLTNEIAP